MKDLKAVNGEESPSQAEGATRAQVLEVPGISAD